MERLRALLRAGTGTGGVGETLAVEEFVGGGGGDGDGDGGGAEGGGSPWNRLLDMAG